MADVLYFYVIISEKKYPTGWKHVNAVFIQYIKTVTTVSSFWSENPFIFLNVLIYNLKIMYSHIERMKPVEICHV